MNKTKGNEKFDNQLDLELLIEETIAEERIKIAFDSLKMVANPENHSLDEALEMTIDQGRRFLDWKESEAPLRYIRHFVRDANDLNLVSPLPVSKPIDHPVPAMKNFTIQIPIKRKQVLESWHLDKEGNLEFPINKLLLDDCIKGPQTYAEFLREDISVKIETEIVDKKTNTVQIHFAWLDSNEIDISNDGNRRSENINNGQKESKAFHAAAAGNGSHQNDEGSKTINKLEVNMAGDIIRFFTLLFIIKQIKHYIFSKHVMSTLMILALGFTSVYLFSLRSKDSPNVSEITVQNEDTFSNKVRDVTFVTTYNKEDISSEKAMDNVESNNENIEYKTLKWNPEDAIKPKSKSRNTNLKEQKDEGEGDEDDGFTDFDEFESLNSE